MAFESHSRSRIIKLRNCLIKNINLSPNITSAPLHGRTFFIAIFLFESLSITLCGVFIFRFFVSFSFITVSVKIPFLAQLWANLNRKYNFKTSTMPHLSVMTLEMPEIDSKGQSAHLCFYLLNAFNFPVLLFSRCMSATADLCLQHDVRLYPTRNWRENHLNYNDVKVGMSGFFRESRDILGAFTLVSTIFHPANCPIDFLKSFLFGFFY